MTIEPTEDEKRNGWDAESLEKYLSERATAQDQNADWNSPNRIRARRPATQNHKYNPHRWRS